MKRTVALRVVHSGATGPKQEAAIARMAYTIEQVIILYIIITPDASIIICIDQLLRVMFRSAHSLRRTLAQLLQLSVVHLPSYVPDPYPHSVPL